MFHVIDKGVMNNRFNKRTNQSVISGRIHSGLLLVTLLISMFFTGCNSGNSSSKEIHIRHTQDWAEYVASATTIKEIDDGLASIPVDAFIKIYEELSDIIIHKGKENDFETQNNCRAIWWMLCYSPSLEKRASKEQYERFIRVGESNFTLLSFCLSRGLGDSTEKKMLDTYADYVRNGNNQKLYY